ncbi:TPA_asm: oncoid1 [Capsaspora MELD virus 2]|nr:TPA_asm: oncoid1 [Capsaspora MELD virus 2]
MKFDLDNPFIGITNMFIDIDNGEVETAIDGQLDLPDIYATVEEIKQQEYEEHYATLSDPDVFLAKRREWLLKQSGKYITPYQRVQYLKELNEMDGIECEENEEISVKNPCCEEYRSGFGCHGHKITAPEGERHVKNLRVLCNFNDPEDKPLCKYEITCSISS